MRTNHDDGNDQARLGVYLDWFSRSPFRPKASQQGQNAAQFKPLQFRAGYLYRSNFDDTPDRGVEHRISLELTYRFRLPAAILLSERNRGDLRFVDGEFAPRYRNKVTLERDVRIRGVKVAPYASAEAFYDWRHNAFNRFRYSAGAELEAREWLVVEPYYLRQQDSRETPHGANVIGLVLQFYAR